MNRKVGSVWFGLGMMVLNAGCWSSVTPVPAPSAESESSQELIGGFGANNSRLDAVGSIALAYVDPYSGYSYFDLLCSGALISANTVLTAKHCIEALSYYPDYGYKVVFGVGPETANPKRWVEVIDLAGAPGDYGGFNGYGHDVGVLHLAEPLDDVPTVQVGALSDGDVGANFVGIGFGDRDNSLRYGIRRVGKLTLQARQGSTYGALLGSFDAFYEWFTGEPLPPECADVSASGGVVIVSEPVIGLPAAGGRSSPGGGNAWASFGGSGGGVAAGSGAAGSGFAGSGGVGGGTEVDCYYVSYVRAVYDSVVLEQVDEVVAGHGPGNAQPCYGDSGSPLLRANASGELVAYGVVSGGLSSRRLVCDYGAVYAGFNDDVLQFLDDAMHWVDPCGGLSSIGQCDGSVARRCSTLLEGQRRLLEFDCADVGLDCAAQADGSIGCGEDDASFAAPAAARSGEKPLTPRTLLAPVFRVPPK